MRRLMRATGAELLPTLLVIALFLLAGCGQTAAVRPDLPAATLPVETTTVRQVFVPITPDLTASCPIADGPVAKVFEVADARRQALIDCNSRMAQIRAIQGTPVKPPKATPR